MANEGRAILVVKNNSVDRVLNSLRRHPLGKDARIIGKIIKEPKTKVILNTVVGTQRIVDMLTSEPLPRIC